MSREFLKFWVGQSVSMLGNQFTLLALPIAAAVTLRANAAQMGVLGAMRFGPGIVFGLPAGVWLDRTRRKPILVASQAVSAVALATIPAAALLHHLTIGQLYFVAFVAGAVATAQGIALLARGRLGLVMAGGASLVVLGQSGALIAAYSPHQAAFPILIAFGALLGSGLMIYNINQQSIRQAVTPDRLLGRVQSGVFVLAAAAGVGGSLLGERSGS